jgi:hypothetical protein
MSDLPLHLLTDAGFTPAEADSVVQHLINGVEVNDDNSSTNRIDVESLPLQKKEALEAFTLAVAADR